MLLCLHFQQTLPTISVGKFYVCVLMLSPNNYILVLDVQWMAVSLIAQVSLLTCLSGVHVIPFAERGKRKRLQELQWR